MLEANVYNTKGTKAGTVTLPEAVFGQAWNADLVHEVVVSMMGNARRSTAHTKGRGDVRGGGKKPWRQKGTGRARHGSRRSPIWRGGGITFGPLSERDYSRKINRKARSKALAVVLSKKFADGELAFVDSLSFAEPKARDAKAVLGALGAAFSGTSLAARRKNAALVVLPGRDVATEKSFRNFGNVGLEQVRDINPVTLLTYKNIIVVSPDASIEVLTKRIGSVKAAPTPIAAPKAAKPAAQKKPRTVAKKTSVAKRSKKVA